MVMPGRTFSPTNQYRYGFNGKEKDTESPVQYDYGFRIYDPRLVRFKSVDPLTQSFPWYTPYQFAGNKPIAAIDLDGLEDHVVIYYKDQDAEITKIQVRAIFKNNGQILDQNIHKRGSAAREAKGNVLVFEASKNENGRYILSIVKNRNKPNIGLTSQEREIFNSNQKLESEQGQTQALAYPELAPNNQYESKDFENADTRTYKAVKILTVKLNSGAVYLYSNPGPKDDNGALAYNVLEDRIKELPKDIKEDGSVKSLTITLTYYMNSDLNSSELKNYKEGVKNAGENLKKYLQSKGIKQEINVTTVTPTYTPDPTKPKDGRPANNSIEIKINR
jgi:RHS repeat-associated protein